MEVSGQTGSFTPGKRAPGTRWIGSWVGPNTSPDAVTKKKFPAGNRTSVVQSLA